MRLLVVEDEPDLLAGLARALRKQGYAVDTAADGEEGLYKAKANDYDAIVLDVMLPGLDGWTILQRLRKSKKTPVLMLTARDAARDRIRGLDTGADDYVVKPFDLHELFGCSAPTGACWSWLGRKFLELKAPMWSLWLAVPWISRPPGPRWPFRQTRESL